MMLPSGFFPKNHSQKKRIFCGDLVINNPQEDRFHGKSLTDCRWYIRGTRKWFIHIYLKPRGRKKLATSWLIVTHSLSAFSHSWP